MTGLRLAAEAYRIPTDAPEGDGTLAWSSTTLVLVRAEADGHTGLGWTYGPPAVVPVVADLFAPVVTDLDPDDVPAAWTAMRRRLRNAGRPGVAGLALSAADCAIWDLKARRHGLSLARLLGTVRRQVPVYGSGGFTTYDEARQHRQLAGWVHEQGIPRVKIKIGGSCGTEVPRDLARMAAARRTIGEDAELYVDANGAYQRKQAIRVAHAAADLDVRWYEEPVSSDDLPGLGLIRDHVAPDVAAGEYGFDLVYFHRMAPYVDCLQIDVTRCGGISEFLRAAAVAAAAGLEVSAHCAPHQHLPVAAATPNLRHIEWFHDHVRIESMLFDGAAPATGGAAPVPLDRPGNGLDFRADQAQQYRVA
ncbi:MULTISPECIES: enolase C-terminal domain-like protein [Micromonospora]|uniref:Mandelate racemase n=1 Tax=Micromonospora solifontis TaxID=2487138 RepID=A0ABX9WK17_9ACTN|nr:MULTISPECIES: enolase C-terminal domain-like protein [Micromonospora]NES13742.1 mandelate racemase [Micromonospora sp. PPF5-17B]NES35533.1 mandelate racemase [Micromonospora solifontis]NES55981.1 mandelate racemase [Micromonospora sp. PPF5-6]RNM00637.1 mandelate racemase [Micromonospora solifontis]